MGEQILTGVAVGAIMLAIGAFIGRFSVRSKTADDLEIVKGKLNLTIDRLDEHIKTGEERNALILDSLLAIMLTLKKGEANGEIDGALSKLNEYTIKNSSKN